MKICGVVIWYKPGLEEVKNIQSYIEHIDELIVVDNSNENNAELVKDIKKVKYLPNLTNLGIAKALNRGCKSAIESGYEWILTMDQDSNFSEVMISKYIESFNLMREKDDSIAIFAPKTSDTFVEFGYVNLAITSGNILSLEAYQVVDGFDDNLFIDEVDHDMCFKLQKSGFKIYMFEDIELNHKLGNMKKVNFIIKDVYAMNHSHIRKYYITRNRCMMKDRHPEFTKSYNKESLRDFIKLLLIEDNKVKKIKYMVKGYNDYKKNVFGKLKE